MTTPNLEQLEHLILKYIMENPGAMLSDIATGPRVDEAARIKPGKAVQLIHLLLPVMAEHGKVRQRNRKWYIQ